MIKIAHKKIHGFDTKESATKFAWFLVDRGVSCMLSVDESEWSDTTYVVSFEVTKLEYVTLMREYELRH